MDAVALEGTPVRSAIRVVALVPGSPAAALGVKQGDIVTALQGEELLVPPEQAVQTFRDRLKPYGAGEKVKLHLLRDAVTIETKAGGTESEALGTGAAWNEALPDLRRLIEENPGKIVTVSAEKARWERDLVVTLGERPGTRQEPLPENGTLRPDLEAAPLEPEAAFARELVGRAGLRSTLEDVTRRLEEDENVKDPFRLKTVRYLKRDPFRLPGATKKLARTLAPFAKSADLAAIVSVSAFYLDCETAPSSRPGLPFPRPGTPRSTPT